MKQGHADRWSQFRRHPATRLFRASAGAQLTLGIYPKGQKFLPSHLLAIRCRPTFETPSYVGRFYTREPQMPKSEWPTFSRWGKKRGAWWQRALWHLDDMLERIDFQMQEWRHQRRPKA